MADTKFDVPIWHKTNLTVEEAAAYRLTEIKGNVRL